MPFSSFASIADRVFGGSPDPFRQLADAATRRTVRIAVLDDSQVANTPAYNRALNYYAWKRFGNAPETPVYPIGSMPTGDPATEAHWLVAPYEQNATATRIASTKILPGIAPKAFRSGDLGSLSVIQHDAIGSGEGGVADPLVRWPNGEYLPRASDLSVATVTAEIFAATNASSGEVDWAAQHVPTAVGNYFAPVTGSGTTALSLESGTFAIKRATVSLPYGTGLPYMQAALRGSHASKFTDIVGLRIQSNRARHGPVFQPLGVGGYLASSFALNHSDAGLMWTTMGPFDAVLHGYGANDSNSDVTAQQFADNTAANRTLINGWHTTAGLATPLHYFRADSYRTGLSAGGLSQLDQYPAALAALAADLTDSAAINSRKRTDARGLNALLWSVLGLLGDGIHYLPPGAHMQAQEDVAGIVDGWGEATTSYYAGLIQSQTDLITSGGVNVISAYANGTLQIRRGDTYSVAAGQTLVVAKPSGASWPSDLASIPWTVTFKAAVRASNSNSGTATLSVAAVVVDATHVRIDLTNANTALLALDWWDWELQASTPTPTPTTYNTLISGPMRVIADR